MGPRRRCLKSNTLRKSERDLAQRSSSNRSCPRSLLERISKYGGMVTLRAQVHMSTIRAACTQHQSALRTLRLMADSKLAVLDFISGSHASFQKTHPYFPSDWSICSQGHARLLHHRFVVEQDFPQDCSWRRGSINYRNAQGPFFFAPHIDQCSRRARSSLIFLLLILSIRSKPSSQRGRRSKTTRFVSIERARVAG